MLQLEIDGKQIEVPEGSTVMDAARQIGTFIPHFCYHKKLSIAASCRMCLVQVEKAPKPMPACATPVTNGMKVMTRSEVAVKAQKDVMEFLLINHPLDCPICDQGGECQLQDLSVGYGGMASRYQEEKRVVVNKNLGPLVSTDMTRCIHCTRCVRFTAEIGGFQEMGQAFRNEHAEIMPFIESTVDTELSGNIIDLCPVGALTSKPFRFSARAWEMSRRKSVSPHDGLGSNLVVQTKLDRVKRVLPLENEDVNECWLSDKDRFSYEGLTAEDRITRPMIKEGGQWREVDWHTALEFAAKAVKGAAAEHGAASLGALASPHSTLEELYLLQKLVRGLGCDNVDFRLRQSDFSADGKRMGVPWLGMKIAQIPKLDRVLVVGSFLRKDHPLLALRLRQAARKGTQVSVIHPTRDALFMPLAARAVVAPDQMVGTLAQVAQALAGIKGVALDASVPAVTVGDEAKKMAESLASGANGAVFLGNLAQQHACASTLHFLAEEISRVGGLTLGFLGEAANSVGGYLAGALPAVDGLNAARMLAEPRKAYVVLGAEPELDCADGAQALAAMEAAQAVIVLSPFKGRATEYASVILPVAPFTETSGTFVNTEGRVQSFNAVVRPLDETRPGWKVLRVLGNLLGHSGFDYDSSEAVRHDLLGESAEVSSKLSNGLSRIAVTLKPAAAGLQRVADVPIHFADSLVRRAESLQKTKDARPPMAAMNAATLAGLGLSAGDKVKVKQGAGVAVLSAALDDTIAAGCVRVSAAHPTTCGLGAGEITVERV
ncbi:MAG: NADH-quinone oxidoreductase subunit NuoG [Rhodocyclaceae bacterium]|nr:NADH-quinone oxidoreductase subunit NuoG [Rhodocyclaceae bacterium]